MSAVSNRRTFLRLLGFLGPYRWSLVVSTVLAVLSQAGAIAMVVLVSVTIDGNTYEGAASNKAYSFSPPIPLGKGQQVVATVTFAPTEELFHAFYLTFESSDDAVTVPVSGLGGHAGDPFLHVVIDGPDYRVDYDGDGSEPVQLDGSGSHTHEPGHVLTGYVWRIGGSTVSNNCVLTWGYSSPGSGLGRPMMSSVGPSYTCAGTTLPSGAVLP